MYPGAGTYCTCNSEPPGRQQPDLIDVIVTLLVLRIYRNYLVVTVRMLELRYFWRTRRIKGQRLRSGAHGWRWSVGLGWRDGCMGP